MIPYTLVDQFRTNYVLACTPLMTNGLASSASRKELNNKYTHAAFANQQSSIRAN